MKSLSRQNPWRTQKRTLSQILLIGFAKMISYISLCFWIIVTSLKNIPCHHMLKRDLCLCKRYPVYPEKTFFDITQKGNFVQTISREGSYQNIISRLCRMKLPWSSSQTCWWQDVWDLMPVVFGKCIKDIVKWAEPCKCVTLFFSRIL